MTWEERLLSSDMALASPQAARRLLEQAKSTTDEEGRILHTGSPKESQDLPQPANLGGLEDEGQGEGGPQV